MTQFWTHTVPPLIPIKTRKLSYHKNDRVMRPIYGFPEKFWQSVSTPTAILYAKIFNVLLFRSIIWMRVQNSEVRSFTRSWDNRGYSKNWAILGNAHALFSLKFFMDFVRMDPVKVSAKFAVLSFTRSWDNSYCSFELGLRTPILGKGRP